MPVEPGQTLLHYRLVEKIGEGGMGVVWKAEDTKLLRHVALKVLPEPMAADPDRRARFEREARAVAALNHPNIVTLHSVEEADTPAGSVHFITMELVEGQNLTHFLPKGGFQLNRLLEIAIPLADAVSRAHRAGITHRDLKPDNIMIDGDGRLRVLDFGLAKLQGPSGPAKGTQVATITSDTSEGRVLGTVAYMSPEQTEGKNVDARSDVFSLGTVLYEMASGVRPFRGDTTMSTIGAVLKDEPSSITELKPSLPRHLGRIIRRCLAKDPERRYQTALGLRNELEELKSEIDSGEYRRDSPATRPTWALPWIIAVIAMVVAGFFGMAWWNTSDDPPRTAYTRRPITSEIGRVIHLSWSPESEFIAYGQARGGSFDVVVQPVAGDLAEVRAGGPGDQYVPRWSPDGASLAYISSYEPGSFIYLRPPHRGTARKLIGTDIPTLDSGLFAGSMGNRPWSLDSKTLLVSRVEESGQMVIYRVDHESGDPERLTDPPPGSQDRNASYSFDGERVVFERRTHSTGALLTMPSAGGRAGAAAGRRIRQRKSGVASRQPSHRLSIESGGATQSLGDRHFLRRRDPAGRGHQPDLEFLHIRGQPRGLRHVLARHLPVRGRCRHGSPSSADLARSGQLRSPLLSRRRYRRVPLDPHRELRDLVALPGRPSGDPGHRRPRLGSLSGLVARRRTADLRLGP